MTTETITCILCRRTEDDDVVEFFTPMDCTDCDCTLAVCERCKSAGETLAPWKRQLDLSIAEFVVQHEGHETRLL